MKIVGTWHNIVLYCAISFAILYAFCEIGANIPEISSASVSTCKISTNTLILPNLIICSLAVLALGIAKLILRHRPISELSCDSDSQ